MPLKLRLPHEQLTTRQLVRHMRDAIHRERKMIGSETTQTVRIRLPLRSMALDEREGVGVPVEMHHHT